MPRACQLLVELGTIVATTCDRSGHLVRRELPQSLRLSLDLWYSSQAILCSPPLQETKQRSRDGSSLNHTKRPHMLAHSGCGLAGQARQCWLVPIGFATLILACSPTELDPSAGATVFGSVVVEGGARGANECGVASIFTNGRDATAGDAGT